MTCPQCHRPTIVRVGGEWCRWCVRFVDEVKITTSESSPVIRALRHPR